MAYYLKTVIENYCGTGKLSDDEVDFLEKEHIRTMSSISEIIYPSFAKIKYGDSQVKIVCSKR